MLTNPAGLGNIPETQISLSIGAGIGNGMVLDSLGKMDNNWITIGNLFTSVKLQLDQGLSTGIALGKVSDFSYKGIHYTYFFQSGHVNEIIEVRELSVSGGMYESVAAVSYSAAEWLDLGISAGLRFGSVSYDSTYEDREDPENDTLVSWEREFNEFCWHGGIEIPLENSLIGLSWASQGDSYDARAAVGGLLYLDDERLGALGGEVEVGDPGGANSIFARIFGYARPAGSFEIRGSLNFAMPKYEQTDSDMITGVSLGTGIYLGKVTLDAGFSWSSCSRDSVFLGTGHPDELTDSQAIVSFGAAWNL